MCLVALGVFHFCEHHPLSGASGESGVTSSLQFSGGPMWTLEFLLEKRPNCTWGSRARGQNANPDLKCRCNEKLYMGYLRNEGADLPTFSCRIHSVDGPEVENMLTGDDWNELLHGNSIFEIELADDDFVVEWALTLQARYKDLEEQMDPDHEVALREFHKMANVTEIHFRIKCEEFAAELDAHPTMRELAKARAWMENQLSSHSELLGPWVEELHVFLQTYTVDWLNERTGQEQVQLIDTRPSRSEPAWWGPRASPARRWYVEDSDDTRTGYASSHSEDLQQTYSLDFVGRGRGRGRR